MRLYPYGKGNICSIMVGLLKRYSNQRDQVQHIRHLLDLPVRSVEEPISRTVRAHRHLDVEELVALVAAYEAGSTIYELGALYGIHRNTVSQILERRGVRLRYHQATNVDLDRAAELSNSGLNLTEVAAAMGVGRTTLVRARRAARSVV